MIHEICFFFQVIQQIASHIHMSVSGSYLFYHRDVTNSCDPFLAHKQLASSCIDNAKNFPTICPVDDDKDDVS